MVLKCKKNFRDSEYLHENKKYFVKKVSSPCTNITIYKVYGDTTDFWVTKELLDTIFYSSSESLKLKLKKLWNFFVTPKGI